MKYSPKNLIRLTEPASVLGKSWPQYFSSGVGESRRSDVLERSNFASMLRSLGGETDTVKVILFETGWGSSFVELIAVHESDAKALEIADEIIAALEDSCIIDIEHFDKLEQEEADLIWKISFDPMARIAYIREHPDQFEFQGVAQLIGCARGKYFSGYPSELLS